MDISTLTAIVPTNITFGATVKFVGILAAAVIAAGLLFRLFLGRRSALNRAICAGIGVLCVYVLSVIIYTFGPGNLDRFLAPLPFVAFSGDTLHLSSLSVSSFTDFSAEVLSLIILILVYNLLDSLLPDGETTVRWLLLRSLTVIAAVAAHYAVMLLTNSFLPELLTAYGPVIFLLLLVIALLGGLLGALLQLLVVAVNPLVGLLVHFFFSNGLGKQLSKAMLTASILTGLVLFLTHWSYGVIAISPAALLSYIPLLLILILLWWILERVF